MKIASPSKVAWRVIEWFFALTILALLIYDFHWFFENGYLPQPFFYESSDTYMDWFNTAYWAHNPGAYDNWGTLYPPLSFLVLKILGIGSCYTGADVISARSCDWVGLLSIHFIYVLNAVLIALTYLKVDRRTAAPRAFALTAGMPMLYALDRGNILLLCFTCFLLGFGPLLSSSRARWFFAGLAVNFKVYLVGTIAAQLLQRRWVWFEGAILWASTIYIVSFLILGAGNPYEIYRNIVAFSDGWIASSVIDIWFAATFKPLLSLLNGPLPLAALVGTRVVDLGLLVFSVAMLSGQVAIIIAAAATWIRPEAVPRYRIVFLGTSMALISSEAGGYTQILALFFVFMETWKGYARPLAITSCYIICLPFDLLLGKLPILIRESYLSGEIVEIHFGFALGMVLRPSLLIVVVIALSASTIRAVWVDLRKQKREKVDSGSLSLE